ncbi:MAG TPA: esterase-like activity of phytase family protein, partial [Gammaproteobacteria bacterium]|nr:esterase-like activity of phytase family protein [Gammaproteobacteria bacterium]
MRSKKLLALSASVFLLSACGGGGGSGGGGATPVTSSTGVFQDSVVGGLHYETATRSGTTNALGEYDYLPGETVTFSIGGNVLGSAAAGPVVTPLSLVSGAADATDPVVTNIVRLLLTLDDDGDPSNGINIPAATATAAASLTVDFSVPDISTEAGVSTLLAAIPSTPVLADSATAQTHFAATLAA